MVDANDEVSSPSHSLLASNARKTHNMSEIKGSRSVTLPSSNSFEMREGTKKARINPVKSVKSSHSKINSANRSTTRDQCKRIRVDLLKESNSTGVPSGKARMSNKNKQNSLASNPIGALVARLSKCVVRTEEDAEVAMNVSLKLFKSFLDYRVNMNASSAEKLVKAFIALISALEEHLPNVNPQLLERREAEDKPSLKTTPNAAKATESSTKGAEVTSPFTEKEAKKLSSQNTSGGNSSKTNPPPPPPPPEPEDDAPPPPPPPPPPPTHPPPESSTNPPPPPPSYPSSYSYPPPPFTATSPTASSPVYPQSVPAPPSVSPIFPPGTGAFPPPPTPASYQTSGFTIQSVAAPASSFSRPPPPIIRHGFPGPGRPPFPMHPMNFPNQRPPLPPHVPYQIPGIPYAYPRLP